MSTDEPAVFYGGMGHKIIGVDAGEQCYRCGATWTLMTSNIERLIPDCAGPDAGQDHYWQDASTGGWDGTPLALAIECAYGDGARVTPETHPETIPQHRSE